MRWGDWYKHDERTLRHGGTGIRLDIALLCTPATVAEVLMEHAAELTCIDAVHLLIAANAISWGDSFDFEGLGDWTDGRGAQRGTGDVPEAAVPDA